MRRCRMPAPACCCIKFDDMERICVLASDIVQLTGMSERYAQQLLQDIKLAHNKQKRQFITKYELAAYLGIDVALISLK